MKNTQENIVAIRAYLQERFPDLTIEDSPAPNRESHRFKIGPYRVFVSTLFLETLSAGDVTHTLKKWRAPELAREAGETAYVMVTTTKAEIIGE